MWKNFRFVLCCWFFVVSYLLLVGRDSFVGEQRTKNKEPTTNNKEQRTNNKYYTN